MKRNDYRIEVVHVLAKMEQVSWVLTPAGGFVVGCIPDPNEETALDCGILARADTLEEAQAWYSREYGLGDDYRWPD